MALRFALLSLLVVTLCALAASQCYDEVDQLDLPSCCPPCSNKKVWRCISDPHCVTRDQPWGWECLSQCQIRNMQRKRDKDFMTNYLIFNLKSKKECLKLNEKWAIYGVCEASTCPNKCGCPKSIPKYSCNYGKDVESED